MSMHNICFEQKCEKYQNFYLKHSVFDGEIFNIFEQAWFCKCRLDIVQGS